MPQKSKIRTKVTTARLGGFSRLLRRSVMNGSTAIVSGSVDSNRNTGRELARNCWIGEAAPSDVSIRPA